MAMNRESINDRFKLAHHRLVARALRDNPALLDEAREVVRGWKRKSGNPSYVKDWERLLSISVDEVRREITRRTPQATRLRISSPFALIRTKLLDRDGLAQLRRVISRAPTAT